MGHSLGAVNARIGRTWTLMLLQALLALSLVIVLGTTWLPLLVLAFLLRGAIVTASTMVLAFVGGLLPARYQGSGFGLMELAFQGGTMIASFSGGILYTNGPRWPFIASLIFLALAGAITLSGSRLFARDEGAA